jgi:predicted unusual protein kinase regulating ubiquinone biosynthesis (AarF/ABC1/UbiB family)
MEAVIEQVSLLVQNSILHVDLHPGNIVVDPTGKVYLLDFDRGGIYPAKRQKLRTHYLSRWQRAVNKHGLPKILTEMMQNGLK